jgi:hypothetical protein
MCGIFGGLPVFFLGMLVALDVYIVYKAFFKDRKGRS